MEEYVLYIKRKDGNLIRPGEYLEEFKKFDDLKEELEAVRAKKEIKNILKRKKISRPIILKKKKSIRINENIVDKENISQDVDILSTLFNTNIRG